TLYTGVTNDLERRFEQHKNGEGGNYTRSHAAKRIVYSEEHPDRSSALKREADIKGRSRQEKLELIRCGRPT
ncbi:MAG: GIY-YIG nuclease family protein, partial [Patescibacteria group bacterium]|nr:GIY-YIG nuclease family protein [Patescibacteria group bacterium]